MSNHINGVESVPKWGSPFLIVQLIQAGISPTQAGETFPRRAGEGKGLHTSLRDATCPAPGLISKERKTGTLTHVENPI